MSNEIKDNDDVPSERINEEGEEKEQRDSSTEINVEHEPVEETIPAISSDAREEPELAGSISDSNELTPAVDVSDIISETEDHPAPLPTAEETTSMPVVSEDEPSPAIIPVQAEPLIPAGDGHHLLQLIGEKSNKDASSAIFNTVSVCACAVRRCTGLFV